MNNTMMITEDELKKLYFTETLSMAEISDKLGCSTNKVVYWMDKYGIERRTISEAVYLKIHPNGDPFTVTYPRSRADAELFGMGIGIYWGEGTKAAKHSIRVGNTDPKLIRVFMDFLVKFFQVKEDDMKFSLQVFSDININKALNYWITELGVDISQFYKPTVTISHSIGKNKHKNLYGVVTVYYHNKKLRDILIGLLPR
jgi:hypothetical protein